MTAQVIASLQQKGGAGKSTLLCCLAAYLQRDGARVLIIDTDPQQSCVRWSQKLDLDGLDVLALQDEDELISSVERLSERYDAILIDTAGYDSKMATYVISVSDLVFVPTGGDESSIVGAGKTYRHVTTTTRDSRNPPKVFWVVWKVKSRTSVAEHAWDLIRKSKMPVIEVDVPSLIGFERMSWEGGLPEGAARLAVRAFAAELQMMGLLGYYKQPRKAVA